MKKALINPIDLTEGFPSVVSVSDVEFESTSAYYWVDCPDYTVAGMYYNNGQFVLPTPPAPTPHIPTAEENKALAVQRLKNTDWIEVPSVTDPANTPHLLNKDDFLPLRAQARQIAVNPTEGVIEWIIKPQEQWSN
jgi:hypothetical protein